MMARRSPAAWFAVLGWCAVAGWFAFVRNGRVPLLSFVDFGFHELGHMVMYILPINQVLTAAMGSIFQIAIPAGLAAYFWFTRRDAVAGCVCAAWSATNFQDVSMYVADAPYERLELVGGEHDWAFILGREHFDQLHNAQTIANVLRGAGIVLLAATFLVALYNLINPATSSATSIPVAATAPTPDDLFPTASRMPSSDRAHPSTRSWSWDPPPAPDPAPRRSAR
jgi:hypothetical protein